ncbi:Rv0361 family membrane protein [Mycobacterium cookii]
MSSVHDAVRRYARAVQEADIGELRHMTCGVLHEQFSIEQTSVLAAQLAADRCQHGSISVSDFRDVHVDAERWWITATLSFEYAPPLDVRFGLIEQRGRWLLVGADTQTRYARSPLSSGPSVAALAG